MVQPGIARTTIHPFQLPLNWAAIAAKLEAIETMKEDIAPLKEALKEDRSRSKGSKNFDGESSWRGRQSYRPYNKIDFPNFSGGDPRIWLLKAKKYFRYYQIPDEEKETLPFSNWTTINKKTIHVLLLLTKYLSFGSIDGYLSFGSIDGNQNMVQTQNSENNNPPDPIATQLAAIAAKLEAIETMKEDITALKEALKEDRSRSKRSKNFDGESSWRGRQSYRPYNKIDFPNFSGGDHRIWLLKAEKYFRYYQIPDEEKVEIASMHLKGDALDLYSWLSNDVLVNELNLAAQPLAPFRVQIGNGDVIRCGQICKNLPVKINDLKITQDFHPFSL
nr:retrotransposon Gag domain, retroviral aspartyl protease [Tanacetum cinerariifolium]